LAGFSFRHADEPNPKPGKLIASPTKTVGLSELNLEVGLASASALIDLNHSSQAFLTIEILLLQIEEESNYDP
jgi:hypothetical protein